jgi:hypothetical protein
MSERLRAAAKKVLDNSCDSPAHEDGLIELRAALAILEDGEEKCELEKHAIEWEVIPETFLYASNHISVVRRDGFKGRRWGVMKQGYALNKSGEWEWEMQPSSRTEEWLETVRWDDFESAKLAATQAGERKHERI